jgi:hypothetical protein
MPLALLRGASCLRLTSAAAVDFNHFTGVTAAVEKVGSEALYYSKSVTS